MKYLFLDIDGVLNHEKWFREELSVYKSKFKYWWQEQFDPECVMRLNMILNETGARLVVSSTWKDDQNLKEYFKNVGIPSDFDVTPTIHSVDEEGRSEWVDRGIEVSMFLEDHPCDQYVILDDDLDFNEDQLDNHFVHCCADYLQALQEGHEGETGLTTLKMREAINILNK